jgi:hypothetical protein
MAERRMFSKTIIDSDAFIDMPATARLLYFDLSMRADDEGFCGSPQRIIRMTGASKDDLQTLIDSRFIIPFDSGVVVIRHWRIHNYIQSDRFHSTLFVEERKHIKQTANKSYELTDTECIQDVSNADTQVRLGKDRLGKDRVGEARETETPTPPPTLEAVKARYRELCKEHHVTPIQGVAERFITYPHTHWEFELEKWVSDDVAKGKYREANKAINKSGIVNGEQRDPSEYEDAIHKVEQEIYTQ